MTSLPVLSGSSDHDRLTAAVFAGTVSALLGAFYLISRVGFVNPVRPVAITVGIALFIIALPTAAANLLARKTDHRAPWWSSQMMMTIAAFAFTALAGFAVHLTGWNSGSLIAIVGALSFAAVIVLWLRGTSVLSAFAVVVFSGLMSAWVGGVTWGTRYKTPLFWEALGNRGNVHHDPLYNVSIANMMRAYGRPSTGLDGLPYVPYHYGASWLHSVWADLAGLDVLAFYSLAPPVILASVFLAGLLALCVEARDARPAPDQSDGPIEREPFVWIVLAAATIGLVPTVALDALTIFNRHLLISESYITGLAFMLPCAALAIRWWSGRNSGEARKLDGLFLICVVPLLLVCLGFLKVSMMLLGLAALLWFILRSGLYRRPYAVGAAVLTLVLCVVTYKLVSVPAQNQGLVPFIYMRYDVRSGWWPYFLIGHFVWSWLYVAARVREESVPTLSDLWSTIRNGRLLDAEVVAVIAICGFIPGEIISIHGGSAIYFSDVQRWIAAPLMMAFAPRFVRSLSISRAPISSGASSIRLVTAAAWIFAIPLSLTMLLNIGRALRDTAGQNIGLRRDFYSLAAAPIPGALKMRDPTVLAAGLAGAPDQSLIATLRSLDAMPRALKSRTALFIPQTDTSFWQIFREPDRCSYTPLVAPATSGLALIDGMPAATCAVTDQYGLAAYKKRTAPQSASDTLPGTLCLKAKEKGFGRVIFLESSSGNIYSTRPIEC